MRKRRPRLSASVAKKESVLWRAGLGLTAGLIAIAALFAFDSPRSASADTTSETVTICLNGATLKLPASVVYDKNGKFLPAYQNATSGACKAAATITIDLKRPESPSVSTTKSEAPKVETPKADPPKVDPPKTEAPKVEAPVVTATPTTAPPKTSTPVVTEAPKTDAPKTDAPKTEAPKADPTRQAPVVIVSPAPKAEAPKVDATKTTEAPKTEAPKVDPTVVVVKQDPPKTDVVKTEPAKTEAPKVDATKTDAPKTSTAADKTSAKPVVKDEGKTGPLNADTKSSDDKSSSKDSSKNEGEKKSSDSKGCDNWKAPVSFGPDSDRKGCGNVGDDDEDDCDNGHAGINVANNRCHNDDCNGVLTTARYSDCGEVDDDNCDVEFNGRNNGGWNNDCHDNDCHEDRNAGFGPRNDDDCGEVDDDNQCDNGWDRKDMNVRNNSGWDNDCHDDCHDNGPHANFGKSGWNNDRCDDDDHDVCDDNHHDNWLAGWNDKGSKWNDGKWHNVDCRDDSCDDDHHAGWDWDKKDDDHDWWKTSDKYRNDKHNVWDRKHDCDDVDHTPCDDDRHDVRWDWDNDDHHNGWWKMSNDKDKDDHHGILALCHDDTHDKKDKDVTIVFVQEVKVITVYQTVPLITELVRPTAVLSAAPQQPQVQTQAVSPSSATISPPRSGDAGLLGLSEDTTTNTATPGAAMLALAVLALAGIAGTRKVFNR